MICARNTQHLAILDSAAGLETLFRKWLQTPRRSPDKFMRALKRTKQEGRIPLQWGGPHRVLLPFLTKDLNLLYHHCPPITTSQGRAIPQIPNSATCSEYQTFPPDASGLSQILRPKLIRRACWNAEPIENKMLRDSRSGIKKGLE